MLFMKKARFYVHCAWLKHISYRSNWIETQKSFSLSVNISLYSLVWELENFLFSSLSYDNTSKNFFARFHNIQLALTCSSVHITTCVAITLWKTYTIFCNAIVHIFMNILLQLSHKHSCSKLLVLVRLRFDRSFFYEFFSVKLIDSLKWWHFKT